MAGKIPGKSAEVFSLRACGSANAVQTGGLAALRGIADHTARSAVVRIIVITADIGARFSAEVHSRIAGRTTGAIDAGGFTKLRLFTFRAGRTAMGWVGVLEALEVVRVWTDVADMPFGIAGHIALTVDAHRRTADRRITGQTARSAVSLIVVGITMPDSCRFAEVVVRRTLVDAHVVDAGRAAAHRVYTCRTVGTAEVGIVVLVAGKVCGAKVFTVRTAGGAFSVGADRVSTRGNRAVFAGIAAMGRVGVAKAAVAVRTGGAEVLTRITGHAADAVDAGCITALWRVAILTTPTAVGRIRVTEAAETVRSDLTQMLAGIAVHVAQSIYANRVTALRIGTGRTGIAAVSRIGVGIAGVVAAEMIAVRTCLAALIVDTGR